MNDKELLAKYPALAYLGKRVQVKSGMRGEVIALSANNWIEIRNEVEGPEYSGYWMPVGEVERLLTIG